MFGHQNCKENFSDLHTILEAQMILESLNNEQADDVARQITELLSLLSLKAASKAVNTLIDPSLRGPTKEAITKCDLTPLNSFATRLRLALANSGMTQAQLADKADVSQGLVSKLVLGKAKESRKLFAIARALGVRVNWLLYGEGEMYSKQPESLESQIARLKFSGSNS